MKLLTVTECAAIYGCCRQRIHFLIKSGRLPAAKYGRAYLVKASNLARLMRAQER